MHRNYVARLVLLSIVGGSADAIAYIRYGVFVGAMTGNTVLIGIDLTVSNFGEMAYHSAVIGIFLVAAILTSAATVARFPRLLLLAGAALLLGTSELVNDKWSAAMSAAALSAQNTTMRKPSFFAVNTAFITGDLVRFGSDVSRLNSKPQEAGLLAVALGCYAVGAIAGAAAEKLVSHGMWMPAAVCFFSRDIASGSRLASVSIRTLQRTDCDWPPVCGRAATAPRATAPNRC